MTDWLGEWFRILEADGENVDLLFGQASDDGTARRWFRVSHCDFDGMGALMEVAERLGLPVPEVPTYQGKRPRLLARLRAFVRYARTRPEIAPEHAGRSPETPGLPDGVAWVAFSEPATKALRRRAKKERVNVNTYLLHAIHRAVCDGDLSHARVPAWLVPVNLRGAVGRRGRDPKANASSFITVFVPHDASPVAVHDALREELAHDAHFGAWVAMNLGAVLGKERYARRVRAIQARPIMWTGSFSYLGAWPRAEGDATASFPAELTAPWFGCPPVSRKVPIGAGCVQWFGRLTLGLQVHPSLAGRDTAQRLVREVVRAALDGTGVDVSDGAVVGFTPWDEIVRASGPVVVRGGSTPADRAGG